jgi:peptide/nickel transport system permease protein
MDLPMTQKSRTFLIASVLSARALRLVLVIAGASLLAFALVKLSPVDPVDAYLGPNIMRVGPDQRAQIAAHWGFDQPAYVQFYKWAANILSGDLGRSSIFNEPVADVIAEKFKASLALTGSAWLLSGFVGFSLGCLAGARPGSLLDRAISIYAYVLASTPTFWIAIVLLLVFSVSLGWTPVCCAAPPGMSPEQATWTDTIRHLALPVLALSILGIAQTTMHTRAKMIEVMQSDYVAHAFAQGGRLGEIVLRHGVRNAALPALTIQFTLIGELFGGSLLAEQVFTYPGLGKATVEAGLRGDVPLMLAISICAVVIVSLGNATADALHVLFDPRVRMTRAPA